jgi:hypothetical protein
MLVAHDDDWFEWQHDANHSVRVRLGQADDGRLHVAAIHIDGNDLPISANTLRAVPLGRIEAHANAHRTGDRHEDAAIPDDLFTLEGRGRSDDFYAHVAAVYRHLVGQTKQPVQSIAEANNVPKTTAHRWIKEARNRGLLPPGRPGKAG